MADPPEWYDEVIDLSLDEASGLMEMGVRVYKDYASPHGLDWYRLPFNIPVVNIASEIKASEFYTRLYYIPKEPDHDTSQRR